MTNEQAIEALEQRGNVTMAVAFGIGFVCGAVAVMVFVCCNGW